MISALSLRQILSSFLIFMALFGFFAQSAELPSVGFYQVDDVRVPIPVRDASESVFQIIFMSKEPSFTVDVNKAISLNADLVDIYRKDGKSETFLSVVAHQWKNCLDSGYEFCPIHTIEYSGSSFLFGDKNLLWTNFHNLAAIFPDYEEENGPLTMRKILNLELPLVLLDQFDQVVFSHFDNQSARADLVAEDLGLPRWESASAQGFLGSDFVRIRLSKDVGEPLKLAKDAPARGDQVFVLGFPGGTGEFRDPGVPLNWKSRDRHPAPDSIGGNIYVTSGKLISAFEELNRNRRIGKNKPLNILEFSILARNSGLPWFDLSNPERTMVFLSTAEGHKGNSGGPMLNSKGEVFAIAQSSLPKPIPDDDEINSLVGANLLLLVEREEKLKAE